MVYKSPIFCDWLNQVRPVGRQNRFAAKIPMISMNGRGRTSLSLCLWFGAFWAFRAQILTGPGAMKMV